MRRESQRLNHPFFMGLRSPRGWLPFPLCLYSGQTPVRSLCPSGTPPLSPALVPPHSPGSHVQSGVSAPPVGSSSRSIRLPVAAAAQGFYFSHGSSAIATVAILFSDPSLRTSEVFKENRLWGGEIFRDGSTSASSSPPGRISVVKS
ncbi:hypothetical protein NDU88_000693 [Pleurodeles waltl]|uniref:Uncharacterized protein n=1 Tax=Pleurodeles waltl TaxID=8319 RepID=A0AAV7VVG9_PLEWA|nr:hypothetical protein NDU88_000693 [Pleurodeles waltl]